MFGFEVNFIVFIIFLVFEFWLIVGIVLIVIKKKMGNGNYILSFFDRVIGCFVGLIGCIGVYVGVFCKKKKMKS